MRRTVNIHQDFTRNLFSIKSDNLKAKEISKSVEKEMKRELDIKKQTNKQFVFEQLNLINIHQLPIEVINILTDPHKCKEHFGVYKTILTTVVLEHERYYTTKFFRYWKTGKSYCVTNDWYQRNRVPFSNWLKEWCKTYEKERLLSFSKN